MTDSDNRRSRDRLLVLAEFHRSWRATGAVLPSGHRLAAALCRHIHPAGAGGRPVAALEVGAGTGAVTREIVRRLGPADTADVVEPNPRFAAQLRDLLGAAAEAGGRVRLHARRVEDVALARRYDAIVCGLPFANFPPAQVAGILDRLTDVLAGGGRLSFFAYGGLPRLAALLAGAAERERLAAVRAVLADRLARRGAGRELVAANVPPAWVHHLTTDPPASSTVHGRLGPGSNAVSRSNRADDAGASRRLGGGLGP